MTGKLAKNNVKSRANLAQKEREELIA